MTSTTDEIATASPDDADEQARAVEEQLTDDERFSLVISVMGSIPGSVVGGRDPRIQEDVTNTSAGYTPGVQRLGIRAIQSSDAAWASPTPAIGPTTRARPRSPL